MSTESAAVGKHPMHRTMSDTDHDLLVALKALADPNRLRVAGACAAGPRTVAGLAAELALPEPAVRRHLERLIAAGLIHAGPAGGKVHAGPAGGTAAGGAPSDVGYALRLDAIHAVGRRLATIEPIDAPISDVSGPDGIPLAPEVARIIRGYLREDRLTTIPSQEKKRLVVIRYLRDRCFTEDRPYPEKEVNQRLALFHPDVATLRRAMVDDGLMTRAAGVYRRPAQV